MCYYLSTSDFIFNYNFKESKMFNSTTHDNLVKNLKSQQIELFTVAVTARPTSAISMTPYSKSYNKASTAAMTPMKRVQPMRTTANWNIAASGTRSKVVMMSSTGKDNKISAITNRLNRDNSLIKKSSLSSMSMQKDAANKYEHSESYLKSDKFASGRTANQDVAMENFLKKNNNLMNAAYQTIATIGRTIKNTPFANDFAMMPNYEVNGNGAIQQKKNHFDGVFKSIALNGSGASAAKTDASMDLDDEDEDDEEDFPQPKEGKDIDLGWDIEHMEAEDIRELSLRAQNLFSTD